MQLSILLAFCSALLSAGAAVIQKKVLYKLSALEFSFFASGVILLFSLPVPFFINLASLSVPVLAIMLVKSLLGGSAFLLVMMSLQKNPITTALPLLGLTPAVTALVAIGLLGETLSGWEWLGILLMLTGSYVLEKRPEQKQLQPFTVAITSKSHQYIFGAIGLFAVSSVADKLLVSSARIHPLAILFYQHVVYTGMFGMMLLMRQAPLANVIAHGKTHLTLIIPIALLTIAYRFAQLEATKEAPVALVLAIKRTSIVFASLLGGKLFSEERLAQKILGAALIVSAGFIILRFISG